MLETHIYDVPATDLVVGQAVVVWDKKRCSDCWVAETLHKALPVLRQRVVQDLLQEKENKHSRTERKQRARVYQQLSRTKLTVRKLEKVGVD